MTPNTAATIVRLGAGGFMIFCAFCVTLSFEGYDSVAHSLVSLLDWTGPPHDEVLTRDARWFGGVWAGLGAGFAALYIFLVAPLLTLPNRAANLIARRGGLIGLVIWFVIDSAGSIAAGVPSNAVMNAIVLLLIGIPLILVKFDPA